MYLYLERNTYEALYPVGVFRLDIVESPVLVESFSYLKYLF